MTTTTDVDPAHVVETVSHCSLSWYVDCACTDRFYGGSENDARQKHAAHADSGGTE